MANVLSPLMGVIILLAILTPTIIFVVVELTTTLSHESDAVYSQLENISPQHANYIKNQEKQTQNGFSQTLAHISLAITILVISAIGIGIISYITMIRRQPPQYPGG